MGVFMAAGVMQSYQELQYDDHPTRVTGQASADGANPVQIACLTPLG